MKRMTNKSGVLLAFIALLHFTCDDITDIFPPKVTIVEPQNGAIISGDSLYIKIGAEDNNNIEKVEIKLKDKNDVKIDFVTLKSKPFECTFPIAEMYAGDTSYIEVKAYDEAGNFSSKTVTFLLGRYLRLNSPNGGEDWQEQSTHNITWSSGGDFLSQVKLDYSLDGGSNWNSIVTTYTSNGSYSWTLPDISTTSNSCLVKIRDYYQGSYGSLSDESNNSFTISTSGGDESCATPTGLSTSNITSNQATLSWNVVSGANSYNVRARQTGESSWTEGKINGTSADFSGLSASTQYEWKVQSVCSSSNSDWSNLVYFTTSSSGGGSSCPTLPTTTATGQVTSPAAGSVVSKGSAFTINWSFKNGIYTPGQCHIKLFNGNTEVSSLQNWAINDGVYTWYVSSSLSNSDCYNIRIIHTSNSSIYVIGSYFTIQ
tara:strand:+ start:96 stop:1382 length:1287 start_codon:yes stop_codon:yes gene_type:complete